MAEVHCQAEGTIVDNHISAVMEGNCDAPIIEDGTLMLTYIVDTQIKLRASDFGPGTTLEQAIQDIVARATGDFDGLVLMATDSMRSDKPNGVRVSFIASAHTGCETCAEVSDCPMWENANKYPLAMVKKTDEENTSGIKENRTLKLLH